jgi:hypothetical protein
MLSIACGGSHLDLMSSAEEMILSGAGMRRPSNRLHYLGYAVDRHGTRVSGRYGSFLYSSDVKI